MGGIVNVVVNTIVRMFTRKAVGRAMKAARSRGGAGANAKAKKGAGKKDPQKGAKTGR